jgi:hypothetical protein
MPSAQSAAISEYYRRSNAIAAQDPPLPLPELRDRDEHWGDLTAEPGNGRYGAWRREGGEFVIEVGASSRDIRLRTSIELPDDPGLAALVPDEELLDLDSSRFTQGYRLEEFDFAASPKLPAAQIRDLAALRMAPRRRVDRPIWASR